MKVRMLGKDIEITRQTMLSDGYCLSTVKHAERISAAGDYVVDDPNGDTPGVLWLQEHVEYCRQCWCANAYKGELVKYVEEQHPGMITAYHQGRLSKDILGNGFLAIRKKNPELMRELIDYVQYNLLAPNLQAVREFRSLIDTAHRLNHPATQFIEKAQVIRIDTELIFDAWQLIGSEPDYDKDKLVIDWVAQRTKPPFPNTYLSFSEGVNDHLVSHFFDNMPKDLLGNKNVRGVFIHIDTDVRQYYLTEDSEPMSTGFDKYVTPHTEQQASDHEARKFLWIAIVKAMQDGVFFIERGEDTRARLPGAPSSPWVKDRSPRMVDASVPFYMVRSNPRKSFRDPTKVYGHRHINWSHRWSVTGHWRHYKDGRKVWIGTYVKGPEDKPLIPSVRVYAKEGQAASGGAGWMRRIWQRLVGLWPGS